MASKGMRWVKVVLLALATSGFALSAQAQYVFEIDVTPAAPPTCNAMGFAGTFTGTGSVNLPNTPNNAYSSLAINGGPPSINASTYPDANPGTFPATAFFLPIGADAPYTFIAYNFPAFNGVPVGFGVRYEGTCAADGSATLVITNGIAAPAPPAAAAVPTLSSVWLTMLAALLGALAVFTARRRS